MDELIVGRARNIAGKVITASQFRTLSILHECNDWHCVRGLIAKAFPNSVRREIYSACFNELQEWGYIEMRHIPHANPWGEKVPLSGRHLLHKYAHYYVKLSDAGKEFYQKHIFNNSEVLRSSLATIDLKDTTAEQVQDLKSDSMPKLAAQRKMRDAMTADKANLYWHWLLLIERKEGCLRGFSQYMGTKVTIEQDSLHRQAKGNLQLCGNAKEYYKRLNEVKK